VCRLFQHASRATMTLLGGVEREARLISNTRPICTSLHLDRVALPGQGGQGVCSPHLGLLGLGLLGRRKSDDGTHTVQPVIQPWTCLQARQSVDVDGHPRSGHKGRHMHPRPGPAVTAWAAAVTATASAPATGSCDGISLAFRLFYTAFAILLLLPVRAAGSWWAADGRWSVAGQTLLVRP
jgi:hypothetical protein